LRRAEAGGPFCAIDAARIACADALVIGPWDGFPLTDGHALVVPRRHVASWFAATGDERAALMAGVAAMRERVLARGRVDGWNLGINDGPAAGQTVPHLHVHLIPRRAGDVDGPRGGVRWVVPARARYWRDDDRSGGDDHGDGDGCGDP
jgi:diadenosine tetraphosphate (Ap4A) HIT family hydrolase